MDPRVGTQTETSITFAGHDRTYSITFTKYPMICRVYPAIIFSIKYIDGNTIDIIPPSGIPSDVWHRLYVASTTPNIICNWSSAEINSDIPMKIIANNKEILIVLNTAISNSIQFRAQANRCVGWFEIAEKTVRSWEQARAKEQAQNSRS